MSKSLKVLILGASYGSLLGTKICLAGHDVTLVCLPAEANEINKSGTLVRLPVRGRDGFVETRSTLAPGTLDAAVPDQVDPAAYDLVCLAMQEPQYRAPEIRTLLRRIGEAKRPVMSIMNMPPLPFLSRIPGLDADALKSCYTDPSVWDGIDPALMTLASPDPQAFRPPEEPMNVLQVALPTNFKVATFESAEATEILRRLETDIDAIRHDDGEGAMIPLPVKLRVHDSVFVPLAKWSMLLTGNYRCVTSGEARPISEAVHDDVELSGTVYNWVSSICQQLGANPEDLVPFEKYASAAKGLAKPSSAARALYAGATAIERVDKLVSLIADTIGEQNATVKQTVALVDGRLEANKVAQTDA